MNLSQQTHRGFTLVELMVAMVVLAVLVTAAIPSFQASAARARVKSRTNDLIATLAAARSEAIRRGKRVTVCSSADGASCTAGKWADGYVVFEDEDHDTDLDTGETILNSQTGASSGLLILTSTGGNSYVSFGSDGRSKDASAGAVNYVLRVCHGFDKLDNKERSQDIDVSTTGRISVRAAGAVSSSCPAPTL